MTDEIPGAKAGLAFEPGGKVGPYELVRQIGRGGMAQAWLARIRGADGFSREVVLKRILPEYAEVPSFLSMFRDEAQITAQLRHGNIVQVLEFRQDGSEYYLVLEYVEGRNLQAMLKSLPGGRVPAYAVAAHILAEVSRGLDYAHRKRGPDGESLGIIHRDVSPSNVLLSNDGEVKLADFGIARARSRLSDTAAGGIKGKIRYMAPEALRGRAEPRSDLFSLGCVAFELVTGQPPFQAESDEAVMYRVLNDATPSPKASRPDVPAALDELIRRLLSKDPTDRPARACEVADALLGTLASASPPATEQLAAAVAAVPSRPARLHSSLDPRAETVLPPPEGQRTLSQRPRSKRVRVVVVERSPTLRVIIRRALLADCDILELEQPEAALLAIEADGADCVIAQHMLGGSIATAFDLFERLRSAARVSAPTSAPGAREAVPCFVLLTGEVSDEIRRRAEAAGIDAVISKSNPSTMSRELGAVVGQLGPRREIAGSTPQGRPAGSS